MKKIVLMSMAAVAILTSAGVVGDAVMIKEGKTTVVNTSTLTNDVRGFRGPTPVKIYIKGNKVQKIEPLANKETPKFFTVAKKALSQFEGKSVSKVARMQVDAKTGATFSTKALVKNVQEGVRYYKEHK